MVNPLETEMKLIQCLPVAASGKRNKCLETDIYLMIHTFFWITVTIDWRINSNNKQLNLVKFNH